MSLELFNFLFVIAFYWLGFFIGRYYMTRRFTQIMVDNPEGMIKQLKEIQQIKKNFDEDEDGIDVVVEQRNDLYYVYNKATQCFLGQGHSVDEAMEVVYQRYPDKEFTIVDAMQQL